MAMNTAAVYPLTPNISWGTVATANTSKDGTGTVVAVFTAGSNGAWLSKLKLKPLGTNVASVMRFFFNNGSSNETAGNNSLFLEQELDAITSSEVAAQDDIEIDINMAMPAGYKVNITIGTTVAAGWQVTAIGRDF